jgi:hypothetical protein
MQGMDLRQERKERGEAAERELARVMLDETVELPDRAIAALGVLSDKLGADLAGQSTLVDAARRQDSEERIDREVSRLLRMLEKRSRLVGELERVLENAAKRG